MALIFAFRRSPNGFLAGFANWDLNGLLTGIVG
jgi:hypothetical protein